MKISISRQLVATALCLSGLPLVLAGANNQPAIREPTRKPTVRISAAPPPVVVVTTPAVSPAPEIGVEWTNIKDYTYAQRTLLLSGLAGVQARVDVQVAELRAKRATMTPPTRTADWDFAMQEMLNARAYLRSMSWDLHKATSESWEQQRERVGQAWVRTQDAYGRVKASTTT